MVSQADAEHEDRSGASSIRRTVILLRAVAQGGDRGRRLSDLARETGLHKATASRILGHLVEEQAVVRGADKHFALSRDMQHAMGLPHSISRLRALARPLLAELTDQLEDVTLLSVRSGHDSLCIDRHVGRWPLQALSLDVGRRRPLGVGAGSLSLYSWLDDAERAQIRSTIAEEMSAFPKAGPERIEALAAQSRAQGFTYLPDFVVPGMTGIGAPVRDRNGAVIAAISIAAVGDRLKGERGGQATALLLETRDRLEARLKGTPPAATGEERT
jgi:DNA-binding IclR family transcriptional regulator